MRQIKTSPYEVAARYIGRREVPGRASDPLITAMLSLDNSWAVSDEIAWCSAFANWIANDLGLPRSRNLAARSWLGVGQAVSASAAEVGTDVVILKQTLNGPGAQVLKAPGHVGFFAGHEDQWVHVLGGNQGDAVSVARFPIGLVLGYRRLA